MPPAKKAAPAAKKSAAKGRDSDRRAARDQSIAKPSRAPANAWLLSCVAAKRIELMWWWLVGLWLGGSILFVLILCLREMLPQRGKGSVEKASSQQAEVDHPSQRLLLASALVASAPDGQ